MMRLGTCASVWGLLCVVATASYGASSRAAEIKVGDTVVVTQDNVKLMLKTTPVAELPKETKISVSAVRGDRVGGSATVGGKTLLGWVWKSDVTAAGVAALDPAAKEGAVNPLPAVSSFKEGLFWVEGGESGPYKLWFLAGTGQEARLLATDAGRWKLTRSSDMQKVAYPGFDKNDQSAFGGSRLRIVDAQGTLLASSQSQSVAESCGFSPFGRFYAFGRPEKSSSESGGQHYELCVVDLNNSREHLVARGVHGAKWVPTSEGIVYDTVGSDPGLYHIKTIGSGVPEKLLPFVSSYEPSPSHTWIYVGGKQDKGAPSTDHFLLDLSTGHRISLLAAEESAAKPDQKQQVPQERIKDPRWSDDGRFFAFIADGRPMLFRCDPAGQEASPCLSSGEVSSLSFSKNGNSLAYTMSNPQWKSRRVGIWDCLTGRYSETQLAEGSAAFRGWIGEQVALSANGKVYLVRPGAASARLLHDETPFNVWRWPGGECCMLVQTNGRFHLREISLGGDVTEPFPALSQFVVDFENAGVMTTWESELNALSQADSTYCATESVAFGKKYLLNDLRFAAVPGAKRDMIVVSVKETGKSDAQYLLRRGKAAPQKIGDFAGAFPHWVKGQERVLFFVHGGNEGNGAGLQLYDVPSGKWTKLADSIAPRVTFLLTDAGKDMWSF